MNVMEVYREVFERFDGVAPMIGESVNLPRIIQVTMEVLADHNFIQLEKEESEDGEHERRNDEAEPVLPS